MLHCSFIFRRFHTFFGLVGLLFSTETLLWALFLFKTFTLFLWELAARYQSWLAERWPPRILTVASSGLITTLEVWGFLGFRSFSLYGLTGYVVWLVMVYFFYRHKRLDLFVPAVPGLD